MKSNDKPIAVIRECPMCHREHRVFLSPNEYESYLLWENGLMLIQQALPNLSVVERESLISGYCPECQAKIFGGHEE